MPLHSGRGTADELLAFQRLAWSSLVLSLTRRCPLRCAHCITSSGPEVPGAHVGTALARRWAAELPALAADGLRHLTFTGGEPVLAGDAVRILARAARPLRIRTALVTSAAWATTPTVARRLVSRLEAVAHWDIGFDRYHEEGMGWERIRYATQALSEAHASFSIRVCESASEEETSTFVARLVDIVGAEPVIMRQPVRRLGRAEAGAMTGTRQAESHLCPSSGAFVREDGRVGPCCSGLAYEPADSHPFDFGDAATGALRGAWKRWREDQLLRTLRLVGLHVVRQWAEDEGVELGSLIGNGSCETCVHLWRRVPANARVAIARRAASPAVRAKLDELERHLYGTVA